MRDPANIGAERSLIFSNVANGVPMELLMATFERSETEIMAEIDFVARKIREYRFRRKIPPVSADTIPEIRFNRRTLLENLEKLGPKYLSSSLILPRITVQKIDHPAVAKEAAVRAGAKVLT